MPPTNASTNRPQYTQGNVRNLQSIGGNEGLEDKFHDKWNSLAFEATAQYSQGQLSAEEYGEESEDESEQPEQNYVYSNDVAFQSKPADAKGKMRPRVMDRRALRLKMIE